MTASPPSRPRSSAGPASTGSSTPFDASALDDGRLVTLAHGAARALIAPHVGGSIAAFYDTDDAGRGAHHWLRPATRAALDACEPLGMASFPLMPYCNRIRDGRFRFEGETIDLPSGTGELRHALHGHAWRRPWRVESASGSEATLYFAHEAPARGEEGWPFSYEARQHIVLDDDGLTVRLWARNQSARPMPFGFGHHPYYPRPPGTRISTRVRAMWESDAEVLPITLSAHPAVEVLENGLVVDDFDLDNNFSGWQREALIEWPGLGRRLTLRASTPFDFFVLYSAAGLPWFCAEPVSNTTDWLNLQDNGLAARLDVGGTVLAPGESIEGRLAWLPARG